MSKKLLLISTVLIIFALFCYLYVDIEIAMFFKQAAPLTLSIFEFITEFGDSQYALVASFVLFLFYRIKLNQLYASRALFVWFSVAISGILVNILKPIFARPRPKLFFEENLYGFEFLKVGQAWSFPSGHSATAFAIGMSLAILFPKYRAAIFLAAMTVALSRVVLNAHFLSDVVVGSLVGVLTVMVLERIFAKHKCFNIYQNSCTLTR